MMLTGPVGPTQLSSETLHPSAVSYNKHVAAFTKPFARSASIELLQSMPPNTRGTVLDHGAGTGQAARLIHTSRPVLQVHCLDPSAAFLTAAPQPPSDPWASIQLGTALDLEPQQRFVGAISNLVLPFVPSPLDDLAAIRRSLVKRSRMVAVSLGEAHEVEPFYAFWSTLAKVSGDAWVPERYVHFRFGRANDLQRVFEEAGFVDITTKTVVGHRPIKAQSVWKWLVAEMPIGLGESYAKPPPGLLEDASERFLAEFGHKTMWNTRCRMISGRAGDG